MKKSSKIIFSIIIVVLLVIIGVGGYLLISKLDKTNNKINELENKISASQVNEVRNTTEQLSTATENETNNTSNNTVKNSTTTTIDISENNNNKIVKDFSKIDLIASDGLKLGMVEKEVQDIIKDEPTSVEQVDTDIGDTFIITKYNSLGLELTYIKNEEDAVVIQINYNKDTIKTTRGITIGSSEQDVIAAYPKNSILSDDTATNIDRILVIGFPGDDPIYAVNENGKLIFSIENGKVSSISINYGHMN